MNETTFESLGLTPGLANACKDAGYTAPSPIQAQAIPALLARRDLLGLAPTGSGKTAAYALPLLQRLAAGKRYTPRRVRALVLVPTRELAAQVGEVFRRLGAAGAQPIKVAVVFGGVSVNPQMMGLRGGADVVVATPGRLLDLLARNALRLDSVETLVLDEADRLLDLGFAAEREGVLGALPGARQNLLFSATFPQAVQGLADGLLRDAVRVEATLQIEAPPVIEQRAIAIDVRRRTEMLRHLIQKGKWRRVLVFVATRYATEHVAEKLQDHRIYAGPLHGDMSQGARADSLQTFRDGRWDVLVTTDLAARGIDIPGIEVVVNYDLPRSPADYVHRIGRTGRAGAAGLAISFVSASTQAHFALIEKRQHMSLPLEVIEGFEPLDAPPEPPKRSDGGTGGVKGKRPSKKDRLRAGNWGGAGSA